MRRPPVVFLIASLVATIGFAQGPRSGSPANPGPPIPDELTITVNCPAESVQRAIDTPAKVLTVEIRGICRENVLITRNHTALRGADPLVDGFESTGSDIERSQGLVRVSGATAVSIQKLSFSRALTRGLLVSAGSSVNVGDSRFIDNGQDGILVVLSSALIFDTTFASSLQSPPARSAVAAFSADIVNCTRCQASGARYGFHSVKSRFGASDTTVHGAQAALSAFEGGEIQVQRSTLTGAVVAGINSAIVMVQAVQTGLTEWRNDVGRDSYLELNSGAVLAGDLTASAFSKIAVLDDTNATTPGDPLPSGRVYGSVQCWSAAQMFCISPDAISGAVSNCGPCAKTSAAQPTPDS